MSTPVLALWQGQIDGLLVGPGTSYDLAGLEGLDSLPELRTQDEAHPVSDGDFVGDDYHAGRTVTVTLEVVGDAGVPLHDALAALRWATRAKVSIEVWWLLPGWSTPRRFTARVRRRDIPTDREYEAGLATVSLQLRASDPVLYGPDTTDLVTGFPSPAGGLQYPLGTNGAGVDLGYLDYGAASATGLLTVSNAGDADVWPAFLVTGPVPEQGFAMVRTDTGARIQYESTVAAGSTLAVYSDEGIGVIDDVADRSGAITWRDWWPVHPGESVQIAFINLGAWSAAQLRVSCPPGWM